MLLVPNKNVIRALVLSFLVMGMGAVPAKASSVNLLDELNVPEWFLENSTNDGRARLRHLSGKSFDFNDTGELRVVEIDVARVCDYDGNNCVTPAELAPLAGATVGSLVNSASACSTGEVLVYDGSTWNCQAQGGAATSVTSGSSLPTGAVEGEVFYNTIDGTLNVYNGISWDVIGPAEDKVGAQIYTEDNYVIDGQYVTDSINALDQQVKDNADEVSLLSDRLAFSIRSDSDPNTNLVNPITGTVVYNLTNNKLQVFNGTAWVLFEGKVSGILSGNNQKNFNPGDSFDVVGQGTEVTTNVDPATNLFAAEQGQLAYDITDGQLQVFNGNAWVAVDTTIPDTTLTEEQVDNFVSDNGYISTETQDLLLSGTSLSIMGGSTYDLSSIDTTLTESQVDAFVVNNGYLTTESQDLTLSGSTLSITGGSSIDLSSLVGSTLTETEVDNFVDNNGYLTAETQDITLTDSNLSITGGSSIDLSSLAGSTTLAGLTDTSVVAPVAGGLLMWNGLNAWANIEMAGDATINTSGIISLNDNAVNNNKLADNSVTSNKILNGAITGEDLAPFIITDSAMDYSSVTLADFTNDAGFIASETQDISLVGSNLSITGGSTIDLSTLAGGVAAENVVTNTDPATNLTGSSAGAVAYDSTDKQLQYYNGSNWVSVSDSDFDGDYLSLSNRPTFTLIGNNLTLTGSSPVNLSSINTDNQTLALSGTNLTIADGNTLDLSSVQLTESQVDAYTANNGYVSAELDPTVNNLAKASLSCASEQGIIYNGSTWVCATILADGHSLDSANGAITDALYVENLGNVGIGTTSPNQKLDVNGNIEADAFYYSSDQRLKNNIRASGGLNVINQLHGVAFEWNKTGETSYGLIAQEVESVVPELVFTGKDGYKSVQYANLVGPLIEAVKELKNLSDQQQAQIEVLQSEIYELTNQ